MLSPEHAIYIGEAKRRLFHAAVCRLAVIRNLREVHDAVA